MAHGRDLLKGRPVRVTAPDEPAANPRAFKAVVSTAVLDQGRILMIQEGADLKHGRWNLPGGKVDEGESLAQAAVRETWEETGLRVSVDSLGGVYTYLSRSGRHTLRFLFFAHMVGGYLRPDGREILAVRWFEMSHLDATPDSQLDRPAILRQMLHDVRHPQPHNGSRWQHLLSGALV